MTQRGCFITLEGQDGAGKTTNLAIVGDTLERAGVDLVRTREPGGTTFGETLRDLVLNRRDLAISPWAELLTVFAARAQHIEELIEPALVSGRWVLSDRFTDATYAYQGGGRGVPQPSIAALEELVQGGLRPDLTLLFDVDIETGESRSARRSAADRFELEHSAFKRRVRRCYLELARRHPQRIHVIDGNRPLSAVKQAVETVIEGFIHKVIR